MDYDLLVSSLGNPLTELRMSAVYVIGLVEETRALDALKLSYTIEDVPAIKQAIGWAGQRLVAAQKAGHSTLEALFRYFNVDKEIESLAVERLRAEAADDDKNLKKIERVLIARQMRAQRQQIEQNSPAGTVPGTPEPMPLISPIAASSFPETGKKRAPATRPTDTDIRVWVHRVRDLTDPAQRKKAVIQLASLHNPDALPHLAQVFVADPDEEVRQAAQQYGKTMYWGILYSQMELNGSLEQEMERRVQKRVDELTAEIKELAPLAEEKPAQQLKEPPTDDINEILRRAEEGRKRRTQTNRKV